MSFFLTTSLSLLVPALLVGSLSYLFLSFRCGHQSPHFLMGEATGRHPLGYFRFSLLRLLAAVPLPLLHRLAAAARLPYFLARKFSPLVRRPLRRNFERNHLFLSAFLLVAYFTLLFGYTAIFLHLLFSNTFYTFDLHNLYTWLDLPRWHWWFWKCPVAVDAAYVEGYSPAYLRRFRPRPFRLFLHLERGHFTYVPYLCLSLLVLLPFQLNHVSLAYRSWIVLKNISLHRYHLRSFSKPQWAKARFETFLTPRSHVIASMKQDAILLHRRVLNSLVKGNWIFSLILLCHFLLLFRWIYGYGYDPFLDF